MTSHAATLRPASPSDEKQYQLKGKKTAAAAGTSVTSKEEKDEEIPVLCNAATFANFPGRLVLSPIWPVVIKENGRVVKTFVLLDSGSSITMLHESVPK